MAGCCEPVPLAEVLCCGMLEPGVVGISVVSLISKPDPLEGRPERVEGGIAVRNRIHVSS